MNLPIDPEVQAVLDTFPKIPATLFRNADIRETARLLRGTPPALQVPDDPALRVTDHTLDVGYGVAVRLYRPPSPDPLPVVLNFHGGGWVTGNLDSDDAKCRIIAKGTHCAVVSVDYRLAPEHPFPAAMDDAWDALNWVITNAVKLGINGKNVAVAGSSAGGNIAAALALMSRDRRGPALAFQWLMYPVCDDLQNTKSYQSFAGGPLLTAEMMAWYWNCYVPRSTDRDNPYASPQRARDVSGLPPALIQTAEFDLLRDEGEAYGHKLKAGGIAAQITRCPGMVHGFFAIALKTKTSQAALDEGIAALRKAFGISHLG